MASKPYRHDSRVLHALTVGGLLLTGAMIARQGWFDSEMPQAGTDPVTIVFPLVGQLDPDASADPDPSPQPMDRGEGPEDAEWLQRLMANGEFRRARMLLMEQAAAAAADGDHRLLGNHLLRLGRVAIEEQDLDSAEVFLLESLELARSRDDQPAIAHANLELGRKHLRSRELARQAGEAYDILLVARNELQRKRYAASGEKLVQVIENNLAIRRYGAAASAYESLSALYRAMHDTYLAELALEEAARLYARSGADHRAGFVLRELKRSGVDEGRLYRLDQELAASTRRYREDLLQMERARDYQRLYRHYASTGNHERAWEFRLMASRSLAKTSRRSLFHRQADVLAVLYDSNGAMTRARSYLEQASRQFDRQGLADKAIQIPGADRHGLLNDAGSHFTDQGRPGMGGSAEKADR